MIQGNIVVPLHSAGPVAEKGAASDPHRGVEAAAGTDVPAADTMATGPGLEVVDVPGDLTLALEVRPGPG